MRLSPTLLICSFLLAMLVSATVAAQCGGERWAVKVGLDGDAALVNLNATTATTVADLTSIPKPGSLPDTSRIQPTETTTWVVSATLIKYARSYDSDYHMVFKDGAGRTMIGEIPDPGCVDGTSPFHSAIAHARAQFDALFTATSDFQSTETPVQITGVGFFDYFEGQEGYAPNGIELHPIIDIDFGPAFTLSSSPLSVNVVQGGTASSTITTAILNNFNSSVTLSASGLPSGAVADFSPSVIAAPGAGPSTLSISTTLSTATGTYNVVLTGTGGGQSHSVALDLTVTSATSQLLGNPGFENGSGNPPPWSVSAGVIDSSTFMAAHSGTWKAWLNGYGTTHTDTLYQQVSIPAGAISASLSFWKHIETADSKTKANDTLKVQIRNSVGTVLTTLATYSNLNAATGYSQDTFGLLAYKGQAIQIYLIGTENGSLKTSFVFDDFSLLVTTPGGGTSPNFSMAASPALLSIAAGGSGGSTITTSVSGGFNSPVSLSASGLPPGATASFSPLSIASPGSGSSAMTIAVGASTAAGTYNLQVNGSGGSLARSTPLSLTVTPGGGGGTTTQILANEGFENGSANPSPWVVTAGVIDNNTSQEASHGGSWKAWMNGYGTTHTDTLYQQAVIPSTATNVTLTFWRHIDTTETTTTTAYDTLKVQIRSSSGTVLATLATYSNLNAAAGYTQASFDLSAYKGQTVQVYLIGVEDSSLKTSFVFDDFALNVTTP